MQKNTAGKWVVFAYQDEGGSNPGEPVTSDAANITANIRIDGGSANAVDDTNPTELERGYYVFDVTAAETNGNNIVIAPTSSTSNVNVIGCPPAVYTRPNTGLGVFQTTIATLASQTSFTLTLGPADDDALNGCALLVRDSTTSLQLCLGIVSDYTGSSKTVTLSSNPGIFTMSAGDYVEVIPAFLTAGLSTQAKADVNAECDTALSDYDAVVPADLPTNFADLAITSSTGRVTVGTNNDKTGYSISGTLTTLDALDTAQDSQHSTTQSAIATADALIDTMVAGIIEGEAATGTLSTTVATTNLTGYTDDQLIGRIITWTSGDCEGEQTDITDYASTNGTLTFTALTTAPADGDTFKIT